MKNKIALITGGTKGIGFGIAKALLDEGMKVAITGRSQEGIDEAIKGLSQHGSHELLGFTCDVRDYQSQQEVVAAIHGAWGAVDLVVANAGLGHFGSIEDLTPEQWSETIDTNLTGPFYTLKATLEGLKKTKGYYMTISSLAGTNFFAGGSAYNASKFGLTGFTQAAMLDVRKYGIRMTTIMPGSVATYFNNHVPNDSDGWKIQIEDIGQIVVDLMRMNPRTLPSKIEVRPTVPPSAK